MGQTLGRKCGGHRNRQDKVCPLPPGRPKKLASAPRFSGPGSFPNGSFPNSAHGCFLSSGLGSAGTAVNETGPALPSWSLTFTTELQLPSPTQGFLWRLFPNTDKQERPSTALPPVTASASPAHLLSQPAASARTRWLPRGADTSQETNQPLG